MSKCFHDLYGYCACQEGSVTLPCNVLGTEYLADRAGKNIMIVRIMCPPSVKTQWTKTEFCDV